MSELELTLIEALLAKLKKDGFVIREDVIEGIIATKHIILKDLKYSLTKPSPSEEEKESFSITVEIEI